MITVFIILIIIILFIFIFIAGGNFLLKLMVENAIKKENFKNKRENFKNKKENIEENCEENIETLHFQTATNIPLSPYYYKNYVGELYVNNDNNNNHELLYDGIWYPTIHKESPYEYETWKLNGNNKNRNCLYDDRFIQINKPFPENYIDKTMIQNINYNKGKYYTYYNDTQNDVEDKQIDCFENL
jgi:hypothetical protein